MVEIENRLNLFAKGDYKLQFTKERYMKFEGIIYYKKVGHKYPILCSSSSTLEEMLLITPAEKQKIKKDFPEITGKLYIDIIGLGTYVLNT